MNAAALPNILTASRILSIPFIIGFHAHGHTLIALSLLGYAILSDLLDGHLARAINQVTSLGSILDPVADRIFAISLYGYAYFQNAIPWWLAVIVIFRNFAQLSAVPILSWVLEINFKVSPKPIAKWATAISSAFIVLPLVFQPLDTSVVFVLYYLYMMTIASLELHILGTFLPRFIAIMKGQHDTFE